MSVNMVHVSYNCNKTCTSEWDTYIFLKLSEYIDKIICTYLQSVAMLCGSTWGESGRESRVFPELD